MVNIGHASIDENRTIKGGFAGDQTGKEVCTRSWYDNQWNYVLRCTDKNKNEIMAQAMEKACNNNHIGYDQNERNSLRTQAQLCGYDLSRINKDCECDCSSLIAVCCECAGIKVPYNGYNAPTTLTLKTALLSTGVFTQLTDMKYLNTDAYLMRGDILIREGRHVVMVLSGSKPDQVTPVLKRGTKGIYVTSVQTYLSLLGYNVGEIDGYYGPQTVIAVEKYQQDRKLTVDGIWGIQCWNSVG